ncbi:hypothetical protein BBK36DRAFT_38962, partial [Trichoderma citrinoviride]
AATAVSFFRTDYVLTSIESCGTMGNCTTTCSDKTGTLTQNSMTVILGALG